MARLTPIAWRELVQRLRELGFEGPYAGGRHPQMRRGDLTLILPNPHEGELGVGLLVRLLRQAGISREEWLGACWRCFSAGLSCDLYYLYRLAQPDGEGVYRSAVVTGLWLRVAWLWQEPLPPILDGLRELGVLHG